MFTITDNEYDKILSVISDLCCNCSSAYCSESDCEIHTICEILSRHIEKNWTLEDDIELPF